MCESLRSSDRLGAPSGVLPNDRLATSGRTGRGFWIPRDRVLRGRGVGTRRKLGWWRSCTSPGVTVRHRPRQPPVYFRVHGVSLGAIRAAQPPPDAVVAKVFWSPLVDQVGERRQWIRGALVRWRRRSSSSRRCRRRVGLLLISALFAFTTAAARRRSPRRLYDRAARARRGGGRERRPRVGLPGGVIFAGGVLVDARGSRRLAVDVRDRRRWAPRTRHLRGPRALDGAPPAAPARVAHPSRWVSRPGAIPPSFCAKTAACGLQSGVRAGRRLSTLPSV